MSSWRSHLAIMMMRAGKCKLWNLSRKPRLSRRKLWSKLATAKKLVNPPLPRSTTCGRRRRKWMSSIRSWARFKKETENKGMIWNKLAKSSGKKSSKRSMKFNQSCSKLNERRTNIKMKSRLLIPRKSTPKKLMRLKKSMILSFPPSRF